MSATLLATAVPGARGFEYSEQYRHECEVRHVLALLTKEARAAYLDGLEKWRGGPAAERLRADVSALWHARRQAATREGARR